MSSPFPPPAKNKSAALAFCPACGAGITPGQSACWLCFAPLHQAHFAALPAIPADPKLTANPGQFSIATILLVTTLIAVCLGVFRYSPGLGIVLIIFAAPALVRTVYVGRREKRHGQRMTIGGKVGHFFLSLAIMYAVWTAAAMAFFITCAGSLGVAALANSASSQAGGSVMVIGLIASLVLSLVVAVVILRATWPKGK